MSHTHFVQLSLQVTSVIPSAASLGNLNNVWGGSPRILGTGVSFSLSLSWLLPPRALAIKQIRVSPVVVPGLVPTSVYINRSTQLCLFSSLKLMYAVVLIFASACIFLRAQTALQPFSTSKDYCSRFVPAPASCFASLFSQVFSLFLLISTWCSISPGKFPASSSSTATARRGCLCPQPPCAR